MCDCVQPGETQPASDRHAENSQQAVSAQNTTGQFLQVHVAGRKHRSQVGSTVPV